MFRRLSFLLLPFFALPLSGGAAAPDFSRDIQPILSENCYHCHGPDGNERKAGLRLDTQEGAFRVKDGVANLMPGNSAESELIQRIFSTDPDDVMPTPKSHRKLSEKQKQLLKEWVDSGAKWGKHWAFVPPVRPEIPKMAGVQHPLDALVRAKLIQQKMLPASEAEPVVLLRRLYLDLIGLPPTVQEVQNYVEEVKAEKQGKAPVGAAYARQVEKLLNSPRYGERWCWEWLDAARYADSNGYQGDPERTMWPWRDWVTKAINDNMPYDQFTVWQLAGDLMEGATPEQKLATGFNRNHMINGEGGRIAEETRVENVMDRVETTTTVWLGLTMGCSKCHDHKFDQLTMKDYFAMYDFFNQTSEDGKGRSGQAAPVMDMSTTAEKDRVQAANKRVAAIAAEVEAFELKKFPREKGKSLQESEAIRLPGNLPNYIAKTAPLQRGVDPLLEAIGYFKERDPEYTKQLQRLLQAVREKVAASSAVTRVMVMDTLPKRRDTFILDKGAYDKPLADRADAAIPVIFQPSPGSLTEVETALANEVKPMNRLDLAEWIVDKKNPLTARVTVNRFWQAFFGVGLIKTAEDFGVQGETPLNQELLDYLAVALVESGWNVKALHRLIVTSATYKQSSKMSAADHERDPENRWLARGPRFRLPSWMLRDQALSLSGLLSETIGGPPVKPYQPEGIWEEATFGKKTYVADQGEGLYRRTLYTFWRRIVGPTMLFDNTARQTCSVRAIRTNTPLHALVTMNEPTFVESARALAVQVLQAKPGGDAGLLFRRVTGREATQRELEVMNQRLAVFKTQFAKSPASAAELLTVGDSKVNAVLRVEDQAAWTALSLMLLNLDEVLTKE